MTKTEQHKDLTGPMREVLQRMSVELKPLVRIEGGTWSTSRSAGWQCTTGTVRALAMRGLIQEMDDGRTRYILTSPEGFRAQLERMIRATAHDIAQERQDGNAIDHWLEAERRLFGHGLAVPA